MAGTTVIIKSIDDMLQSIISGLGGNKKMRSTFTIILILLGMFAATLLYAEVNNYTVTHDRTTNATIFVFKADPAMSISITTCTS